MKENFTDLAKEIRGDYKELSKRLEEADKKIMKLIIITTLIANGVGQLAAPLLKGMLGG